MRREVLEIIVLYHFENNSKATNYAIEVYNNFNKDTKTFSSIGAKIPIRLVNQNSSFDFDNIENLEISEKYIFIILVDENMLFDINWKNKVRKLYHAHLNSNKIYLIPFSLVKGAHNILEETRNINFYRFNEERPDIYKYIFLLSYKIARIINSKDYENEHSINLSLFLSHEKSEGTKYAKRIRENISLANLQTFLDENMIEAGKDFSIVIGEAIENCSVMIVILTDYYSTREWCVREVICAKKLGKPIVVLNFLNEGEERSFPYLGNARVIRVNNNINYLKLCSEILKEIIRKEYFKQKTKLMLDNLEISDSEYLIYTTPPEVAFLLGNNEIENRFIIYPEPPMGSEELSLLHNLNNNMKIGTRSMFISNTSSFSLENMKIALSISETKYIKNNIDFYYRFKELIIELTRYLIILNANVSYAGNINYNYKYNVNQLIFDYVSAYNYKINSTDNRATQYILKTMFNREARVNIAGYLPTVKPSIVDDDFLKSEIINGLDNRVLNSLKFNTLRDAFISEASSIIIIGGKETGYTGLFSGVLEEFIIAIKKNIPIYLIGCFGGISAKLVELIEGKKRLHDLIGNNAKLEKSIEIYNCIAAMLGKDKFEVNELSDLLNKISYKDLNNGLDEKENKILFESDSIDLIIITVLKGLKSKFIKVN